MGIIAFIILGLLAGIIAKAVLPGDDPGGIIVTTLIGIAGAVIGGFVAAALFDAHPLDEFFDISTWLTAIIGAIVLLLIYRLVVGRSTSGALRLTLYGEGLAAARERADGREPPVFFSPGGAACGADLRTVGSARRPSAVDLRPRASPQRLSFLPPLAGRGRARTCGRP